MDGWWVSPLRLHKTALPTTEHIRVWNKKKYWSSSAKRVAGGLIRPDGIPGLVFLVFDIHVFCAALQQCFPTTWVLGTLCLGTCQTTNPAKLISVVLPATFSIICIWESICTNRDRLTSTQQSSADATRICRRLMNVIYLILYCR